MSNWMMRMLFRLPTRIHNSTNLPLARHARIPTKHSPKHSLSSLTFTLVELNIDVIIIFIPTMSTHPLSIGLIYPTTLNPNIRYTRAYIFTRMSVNICPSNLVSRTLAYRADLLSPSIHIFCSGLEVRRPF